VPLDPTLVVTGGSVLRPDLRFERADVVIRGDTVAELVAPGSVTGASVARFDASDRYVIPGLVNGHTHAQVTLAKGLFDRYTLETYLNALPWASGRHSLEDTYVSAALGALEMVRKGCTAAYDMFGQFPLPTRDAVLAVGRAYRDVGVRVAIAPMMADRSFYEAIPGLLDILPTPLDEAARAIRYAPGEASIEACRGLLRDWPFDRDTVRPALGPTIPHHCSEPFLIACRDLASEYEVGMQMHVAESRVQAAVGRMRYGTSLVGHLDALGLLGPGFCASHAVWLDDDDRRRLADRGASVSHNPGSNLKLGSGRADMRRLLDAGIRVAVGTDGASSSDHLNVFEAMRLAATLSRVRDHGKERWVSAREAFAAATTGGASALGFEGVGRIERGCKADLVFLDASALQYVPANDVLSQLVFAEDGTGVDSVMIGGRIVLEHGRFTTVDVAALRRAAESAVGRLREATAPAKALAEKLAPYVGQYCEGLAASVTRSEEPG
jgi:5-methylthioadenosine/S-adenosylhomocysteine deaminase